MRPKDYTLFLFCIFFTLIIGETASAIGIAPAIVQIENAQGVDISYSYYVRAGSRPMIDVSVACDTVPELEKYISISFDGSSFTPGEVKYFTVYVKIPSNFTIPGRHLCMIQAEETAGEDHAKMNQAVQPSPAGSARG